ncbi:NrdH-redoxin [Priestia filamentosa]|uniref:glutaredoxin domain-containing protein n=1 Tax=Priestia filamentosa TaxID=1402861 RepID=UPI001FB4DE52|nr:glutaredoxin domain-containing protein [Priestia filamentosa]MED3726893.1 glutaredoxin domain-containing protein [Priestia filamentosa]UOE59697.1 NrdH-redoxin [Priestia filamentosa]
MKKVELYTQQDCPPCHIVKQFLTHHNISFIEFDIKRDAKARKHMINTLGSFSTPTVVVEDEIVTGFNIEKLEQLLL